MLLEREDKPGTFQTLISTLFLTVLLSVVYYMKGDIFTPQSIEILANLKSLSELGTSRFYTDPVPTLLLNLFRKFSSTSYVVPYKVLLSFIFSLFLHYSLLVFYRKKWKLYHFLIVYFVAFLPFSFYIPFSYFKELICLTIIFYLIYVFKFEKIQDLINIVFFTLLAFFSDISLFFFAYLSYVLIVTFQKMQEKKSKTTVFFKKKNIPFRILMIYLGIVVVSLALIAFFDFYGQNSLLIVLKKLLEVLRWVVPLLFIFYILQLVIKLEEGVQEYVGAFVILLLLLGSGYYTYNISQQQMFEGLNKIESEIISLRTIGKLPPQNTYFGRESLRNPLYYKSGLMISSESINLMEPNDYLILENLKGTERQYLDRKNIPPSKFVPYYFISSTTIILSKDFINRVLNDPDESDLKKSISQQIESMKPASPSPAELYYRFMGRIFRL
jgi:hypothetical protein